MSHILPISSLLLVCASVLCSCSGGSKSSDRSEGQEPVCFMDTIHHFGSLPLDNPIDSFDFRFVNQARHPIVVLAAKPSCECTRASYPRDPVMPGDTSYIRVTYDGTDRNAEYFNKTVTVTTSASFDDITLQIIGETK